MSEFKLPHVEDLATNSKLPGQLTENFKAIERAVNDLQREIDEMKKQQDTSVNSSIYDSFGK